jgi:hypothetical protein
MLAENSRILSLQGFLNVCSMRQPELLLMLTKFRTFAMVNWKIVHYFSYLAVVFFALEPSYIHPDEHFQSLGVLTSECDLLL